jgi:hypothetical protein
LNWAKRAVSTSSFHAGEVVVSVAAGDIEEVRRGRRVEAVGARGKADLHAALTEITAQLVKAGDCDEAVGRPGEAGADHAGEKGGEQRAARPTGRAKGRGTHELERIRT